MTDVADPNDQPMPEKKPVHQSFRIQIVYASDRFRAARFSEYEASYYLHPDDIPMDTVLDDIAQGARTAATNLLYAVNHE